MTKIIFLLLAKVVEKILKSKKSQKSKNKVKNDDSFIHPLNKNDSKDLEAGVTSKKVKSDNAEEIKPKKTPLVFRFIIQTNKYLNMGFAFFLIRALQLDILIAAFLNIMTYFSNTSRPLTLVSISDPSEVKNELAVPSASHQYAPSIVVLLLSFLLVAFYLCFVAIVTFFAFIWKRRALAARKDRSKKGARAESIRRRIRE